MFPIAKKVVFIAEFFSFSETQLGELDFMGIVDKSARARVTNTIMYAMNKELVQMFLFPAHDNLDDVVQIGYGAIATHFDPSPNHRTNAD